MSNGILDLDCRDCLHVVEMGMMDASVLQDINPNVFREPQTPPAPILTPEKPVDANHEILGAFESHGLKLNYKLIDMLNEGDQHQGGRKGSGLTQSTRELATFINSPRDSSDLTLFDSEVREGIHDEIDDKYGASGPRSEGAWRDPVLDRGLGEIKGSLQLEESKLVAGMITDIVKPKTAEDAGDSVAPLPSVTEQMRIGTCTTAESYFLSYLNNPANLGGGPFGEFNIILGDDGTPLMIEKMGYGEDHSSLTLKPVLINGVELPAGSLLGIDRTNDVARQSLVDGTGNLINASDCRGFQFLRLTTLAVSPANRERAFGSHFKFQEEAAKVMPGYDTSSIDDFSLKASRLVLTANTPRTIIN